MLSVVSLGVPLAVAGAILAALLIIGLFCCCKRRKAAAAEKTGAAVNHSATGAPTSFSNEIYAMPVSKEFKLPGYTELPPEPPVYSEIEPKVEKNENPVEKITKCSNPLYEDVTIAIDLPKKQKL